MAQLNVSAAELVNAFGPNLGPKIAQALKFGVEDHDYDSAKVLGGWVAAPSGNVFTHNLGVLPDRVQVQHSSNADGSSYVTQHPTAVTSSTITVTGTAGYYRVIADK